jgi:hypothetical protein
VHLAQQGVLVGDRLEHVHGQYAVEGAVVERERSHHIVHAKREARVVPCRRLRRLDRLLRGIDADEADVRGRLSSQPL